MKNNVKVFSGSTHAVLSEEISELLGVPLGKRTLKKFSCGEFYINFDETVRGKEVFLITTIRPQFVHEDFFELFLMCDSARRSFAKSVHVIIPHFGYSRQDKIHSARESISMKLCADLLVKSGATHIITLNLHADQSQAFFDIPVDNLSPCRMFVQYLQTKKIPNAVVVSPDAGGAKSAKKFADALGVDLAILHKSRPKHNTSEISHLIGDVQGKVPILYDDMIDTAGSVYNAKKVLLKHGSNDSVYLCATHPIFSGPAIERLEKANFQEIIVTNSIPVPKNDLPLKELSTAPLIAHVVKNVISEKSVSQLYY
jgi:ribose-phosphate pyrophosphokinase